MPADGTVKNLDLSQTLPLMKTFMFDTTLNAFQADSAGAVYQIAQFTMPFYGDIIYHGYFKIQTNAAGIQAPDAVQIWSGSTPAPTTAPYSTWRTAGGSGYAETQVPLFALWTGVGSGTTVTVQGYVGNGSGGISITVIRAAGIVFCTKT
jgi:hypothetical protein